MGEGGAGRRAKRAKQRTESPRVTHYPVTSSVLHWRPVLSRLYLRVHKSNKYTGKQRAMNSLKEDHGFESHDSCSHYNEHSIFSHIVFFWRGIYYLCTGQYCFITEQ